MGIQGHISGGWNSYEAPSAAEEQTYDLQNLIIEAELKGDEVALAGIKRCYEFVLLRRYGL